MKQILLLLFLWLLLNTVQAQEYQYVPFPDSNAVWSEVYWKPVSEPDPRWDYHHYVLFDEDTSNNGIIYHKLYSNNTITIERDKMVCVGMLREDSLKQVWFRYNTTGIWPNTNENGEYLLYDFGLKEGDTIHCYEDYLQYQGVDFLVLDSIRYISINNSLRRIFYFNIPWEVWIEGIGKIKGLIYPSGDLPTNREDNDLICFHQNDMLLYFYSGWREAYYDDCVPSFVLNGVSILPNPDIKVYPNPVTENLVYFENLDFELLELYDINGCCVLSVDLNGHKNYTLNVSQYPSGNYFYRLKTKGLLPTCGKLIKNQ